MLLVDRRGDDQLALQVADDAAREHVGAREGIAVPDRIDLFFNPENRDLLTRDQSADAGVRHDVLEPADFHAGTGWPRSFDEHDAAVGLVAVHEMAEALEDLRALDRLLPFAGVGLDLLLHVGLELGADAERVLADDLAHVVDAALEVLQPGAGALQAVAGADVEHQEAVDVLD